MKILMRKITTKRCDLIRLIQSWKKETKWNQRVLKGYNK